MNSVVPYSQNVRIAQLLLLHYGNYDKKTRERKYRLYISQDPDGKKQAHSYGFLRDKKVVLRDTKEIGIHSSKSLNARISQNHE
ncbi:MAG: hypothetical protein MI921_17375 [Cytophagales bacterium]|nr:hypothetical protein [Cytophagales bacterium]